MFKYVQCKLFLWLILLINTNTLHQHTSSTASFEANSHMSRFRTCTAFLRFDSMINFIGWRIQSCSKHYNWVLLMLCESWLDHSEMNFICIRYFGAHLLFWMSPHSATRMNAGSTNSTACTVGQVTWSHLHPGQYPCIVCWYISPPRPIVSLIVQQT